MSAAKRTNSESTMFTDAKPSLSHLKCGMLGSTGSGKSFTSMMIAIGLHKHMKSDKPIFFLDSERGSQWFIDVCKQAKVKLKTFESRAFVDLMKAIDEAEKHAFILIVDSLSHFWVELVDAFKKRKRETTGKNFLTINDWGVIKPEWAVFTERFLTSSVHIIIAGRAQIIMEEDEDNKLKTIDVRMKAEKETGFEPHLLLDMTRKTNVKTKKVHRVMTVLKDRNPFGSTTLDGKQFTFTAADGKTMLADNKVFKAVLPHINRLSLNAENAAVSLTKSSEAIFGDGDEALSARRDSEKRREIVIEEFEGLFKRYVPSRAAEDRKFVAEILQQLFGTTSWTKIKSERLELLNDRFNVCSDMFDRFSQLSTADQKAARLDVEAMISDTVDKRVNADAVQDDLPF